MIAEKEILCELMKESGILVEGDCYTCISGELVLVSSGFFCTRSDSKISS